MKKLFFFLMCLSLCSFVFAQNITVKQNSFQKVALSIATENVSVEEVSVPEGDFSVVSLEGYGPSNNPGAPQLPVLVKFLQIPVCESVVATVTNAQYTEYDAAALGVTHPLYPNQPSVSKSAARPPFSYDNAVYTTDEFYSLPLVSVENTGVQRDKALATMYVSPVQYNPVTQKIRIYSQIDVEFTFVNANMAMTQQLQKYVSPMFSADQKLLLNEQANPFKAEFSTSPIKYLIVANSMFSGNADLEAFANWKRRLGYKVEIAYTSDASVGTTTTSIKSYIQNKYNNATAAEPAPTFLLFIGDVEQMPSFAGTTGDSHSTDLYYATLSGSDNIPDCYYGRLSATNASELKNQLDKIMMYEQYTMPDPSYLGKAVLIAGTDDSWSPTHADGQINYVYNNYINTNSTTHNYTTVYKHSYDCSSQASTIRDEVNAGAGWVNYTAHGSPSGWYSPSFSTSHISSMSNTGKYGLWIGNCCQTGTFDASSPCFAEVTLRAQNKGAMGYIGASQVTYWNEDVYWAVGVRSSITANMSYQASNLGMYDKLFHTHNEAQSTWVSTIGGIMYGGNQAVQASSSSRKLYYWEIYHCFGDPSIRMFLGMPNTMTVAAEDIVLGEEQYQVQVVPYAYVALKKNVTEFVCATFANASGVATLSLPGDLEPGTYELVALAQNYIPYFQNVEVIEEGGCISPSGFTVSNITPFTATLSWNGEAGGVYNIETKAGNANWTTVATGISATSYNLTNLQDDMEYKARVQTVCGSEASSWRTVTFTTPVACPVPTDVTCTAYTATTATLSWTENGSASTWVLQYGQNSNFTSGTYTQVTVTGNPTKALTGLTAETTYYARVKASCGGVYGQSQWSETCTFLPSAVQTFEIGSNATANSTFLPSYSYYNYSFSQQIYTSDEITAGTIKSIAFKNTGETKTRTYSIYLQQTDKETFSSNSDWEPVSSSSLVFSGELTFTANEWTTATFSTPFDYDGSSNLLVTVADNTGSYTTSPHMACLVYDAVSQAIYIYEDGSAYDVSAMTASGTLSNVKNQIRLAIVPSSGNTCYRPKQLAATDVMSTSATLSWVENGSATSWVLQYGTNNEFAAGTYTQVSVSGNPTKAITGLTAETQYYARVKAICDAENVSAWSSVLSFLPSDMTVIGSGSSNNQNLPTNNYYKYSLTQQIYTPAELGDAGSIQSVAFYKDNTVECNRNLDIYMVSTTKSSFASGSDWITVSNANKVFSGTVSFTDNAWTTITLNTPFSYDGTSNVAIIVDDNTGSYKSNTSFHTFNASNQAIRVFSDGTNYDATSPSSYSGTVESAKNQIRLSVDRPEPCFAPTDLAVVELDHQSAYLTWNGEADSWKVAYKTSNASQFTEVSVSTNSYSLTGLAPETGYTVKVAAICGDETVWSDAISFTTLHLPCPAPTNVTVSNVERNSAVLTWTETGTATSWVVAYRKGLATNDQYTEVEVSEPTCTLTDLIEGTEYSVRVRPVCSGVMDSWSGLVNFTTESCYQITLEEGIWEENFDSYTTSTTAMTGYTPDCWRVVSEDATLSDESRPQIYYQPNYASSGAYTLRMKNRCLYSMPLLNADVDIRTLKMTFKLRQPKTYFMLQVGVLDANGNFNVVKELNNTSTGIEDVTVDFSNYSGEANSIAFRNVLSSGYSYSYSYNYLDDIVLSLIEEEECFISLPYAEDFENYTETTTTVTGTEPDCWTLVQEDVTMPDNKKPQLYYKSSFAHSGNYSLLMNYRGVYAMPALNDVDLKDVKLEMYVRQPNSCYQLHVGVWDEQTGTFEPLALVNNSTTGVTYFTCDFSEYTGTGRRIAFRNTLNGGASYNYSYNYIDDIVLTVNEPSDECLVRLPYSEDFENYTIVTSAVTGVEPDCWEMVKTYVDVPDGKQPQLYYKSSYASNGSYSLRMVNRCVYAMPALDADVNINDLHLSMYLRQPVKCYQLEVGVWEESFTMDESQQGVITGEFVPVHTFNNTGTGITFVECDFSNYTGDGHRIAFRNSLNSGARYEYSYNYIDEIMLDYGTVATRSFASDENVIDEMGVDSYLENIAVYPNPTTGVLHIDAMDVQKVECYSPMGQLVAVYDNESDINISNLAQGVYTLRITVPQGVTVRKVVKR